MLLLCIPRLRGGKGRWVWVVDTVVVEEQLRFSTAPKTPLQNNLLTVSTRILMRQWAVLAVTSFLLAKNGYFSDAV